MRKTHWFFCGFVFFIGCYYRVIGEDGATTSDASADVSSDAGSSVQDGAAPDSGLSVADSAASTPDAVTPPADSGSLPSSDASADVSSDAGSVQTDAASSDSGVFPPSTPTGTLRIEVDPTVLATIPGIGTCASGWVVLIWDPNGTLIASVAGAALTTTVTSVWAGYAAIGLRCHDGGRDPRYVVWPTSFIGMSAHAAGIRSIMIGTTELARGPSCVCSYGGFVRPLYPADTTRYGRCL